jgi:uncharacterized membrane protein
MNAAHVHLVLNHIPVVGIPVAAAVLLYGLVRGSEEVKRVSLLAFLAIAIITVPTYLAGQAAEDIVEHLPGVDDDIIHTHEAAATIGLVVTSILGVLSAVGLLISFFVGRLSTLLTILFLLMSLGVSGWLSRVANLGGKIRHTELRTGASFDDDDHDEGDDDGGGGRRGRNRRGRDR